MASGTRWPTAVDYQTALQAPALCFDDPDLQQADVHSNTLGLPMAATGNVAVVFRITVDDADYALRCFTRQNPVVGMTERYQHLNAYISEQDLGGLVPTDFREDEILVHDTRYPVALMPWIPGKQLHLVIEEHLGDATYLRALAERWRDLMRRLRGKRFAHGDLSDGNVLVDAAQQIHLIDYDAAFVPPLSGVPPSEIGKPNYQHPERLSSDSRRYGYYAENVDAFAALVIYLSLKAIAVNPSLWETYHTGDNLIFIQDDFTHPGSTPIWPNLRSCNDVDVRRLTETLERYCKASVADLPSLDEALRGRMPRLYRRSPRFAASSRAQARKSTTRGVRGASSGVAAESPGSPSDTSRGADGSRTPGARDFSPFNRELSPPTAPTHEGLPDADDLVLTTHPSRGDDPERSPAPDRSTVPALLTHPRARTFGIAVLVVLLALAIGATVVWAPWEGNTAEATQAPVETALGGVSSDQLVGFYTGYSIQPDGSRGGIGLEIIDPVRSGEMIYFSYTLNSIQYQNEGSGLYDPATGHLDLNEQYFLYARVNEHGNVELSSLPPGNPDPTLRVTKTDDL